MWWDTRNITQIMREMDRWAENFQRNLADFAPAVFPAVNIWSNPERIMVTAELPGMKSDEIEVFVQGRNLTIHGKPAAENTEEREYHRRERDRSEFWRTIELPYEVEQDKVEARLEKGLLALALPRAEKSKPRKIEVKVD